MTPDVEALLRDNLALRDEVASQRALIEQLTRPRHWTQDGPRGSQATTVHHALDRVLERAVKVRNVVQPGRADSKFEIAPVVPAAPPAESPDGFYTRVRQATDLLGGGVEEQPALISLAASIDASDRPQSALAWLGLVAALGRWPNLTEFGVAERALRGGGGTRLIELLERLHLDAAANGQLRAPGLAVCRDSVVLDVTHTARHDLHTGIQRVVRELGTRWLSDERTVLVWWDEIDTTVRQLGGLETFRFRDWLNHLPQDAGSEPRIRDFSETPPETVVPWDGVLVLPELAANHARASSYQALVRSGLVTHLAVIGYDLVPVTAAETVHEGMVGVFNTHVSLIKLASRLSAISESAANEFSGLVQSLAAQGIEGPAVEAHPLPPTPWDLTDEELEAALDGLCDHDEPVVLVVGSREPRKNQIAVLEAAGELWSAGRRFHLVMVGGSGWNSGDVDDEIERLRAEGGRITVRVRTSDTELFAWYRRARFSVFPSLYEGFGLPIVESLGVATPVITSNYGAMREVAEPGGALLVDPRDPAQVRVAIDRLLTDDDLLADLRLQASARVWPTWDEYSANVWEHLVGPSRS